MKTRSIVLTAFVMVLYLNPVKVNAQWAVHDPINFAQQVLNYAEQLSTAANTLDNVDETRKVFTQGKKYYDSLQDVHHMIKDAKKVQESIELSLRIIDEYGGTCSRLSGEGYFTSEQISVYNRQQSGIMQGIASAVDDLTKVVTNTGMSMSDKERLDLIDTNHRKITALFNKSRGLNMQMIGESEAIKAKKDRRRLERELLR